MHDVEKILSDTKILGSLFPEYLELGKVFLPFLGKRFWASTFTPGSQDTGT